jgi:hypothetical protein
MPERDRNLLGRLAPRGSRKPTERDWQRSTLLEPRLSTYEPELISDGSGLAFPPDALNDVPGSLELDDPAVTALVAQLARQKSATADRSLDRWRLLARTEDRALFGRGQPPKLVTVSVRLEGRRRGWRADSTSAGRPLRASRDGIRASGWRLDPDQQLTTADTVLRILVTEQTWSSATRADDRLLAPDLHLAADELVLRVYITPRGGFQTRVPNPETPARIQLPEPVGPRLLIDGAMWGPLAEPEPGTSPGDESPEEPVSPDEL